MTAIASISVRIYVDGHIDDLYALSLLFREGTHPELHVVTNISGTKEGLFDRARETEDRQTFVTGDGCLPLAGFRDGKEAEWTARAIIAPLNGYAVLADSNFTPVTPTQARIDRGGHFSMAIGFGSPPRNAPDRLITTDRHPALKKMLPERVRYLTENPLAAYASNVIAGTPSWAEYYRLLEDIAGHRETTLDKLHEAGLASRRALSAFKNAANNRAFGRHGTSKRNTSLSQDELMNLLEARQFVRSVVTNWLDLECGGCLPRDRVDGGALRFGLDDPDI